MEGHQTNEVEKHFYQLSEKEPEDQSEIQPKLENLKDHNKKWYFHGNRLEMDKQLDQKKVSMVRPTQIERTDLP